MSQVKRSGFTPILNAIVTQLTSYFDTLGVGGAAGLALVSNQIKVITRGVPSIQSQEEVLLIPGSVQYPPEWQDPAGRVSTVAYRTLEVMCRVKRIVDGADTDIQWLTDTPIGLYALEEGVIDALQCFFPTDTGGNALTYQPLHLIPSTKPERHGIPSDPAYGFSLLSFAVMYALDLTQAMQ